MTAITPTLKRISNVGEDEIWEASVPSTITSSADSIVLTGCPSLASGDHVKLLSATTTTATCVSVLGQLTYYPTRHISINRSNVDSTIAGNAIRIEFKTKSA